MFEKAGKHIGTVIVLMLILSGISIAGDSMDDGKTQDSWGGAGDPAEICNITGYINNTTGSPFDNLEVRIVDSLGNENDTKTDAAGKYEIWVRPGQTKIVVFNHKYRGQNRTIVAAQGENTNVNFTLAPLGPELVTIKGFIGSADGKTFPGSGVYLTDEETWENMTFANETTGQYEINCVNGTLLWVAFANFQPIMAKELVVVDHQVLTVDYIKPMENSTIKGYVEDETGAPMENITVFVINDTHMYANSTKTDATGYYELGVIEDWLNLMIEEEGYWDFHDRLYVEDSTTIWLNTTLLEAGPRTARLFGRVTDEETGDPIEGAIVEVELEEVDWRDGTATDANGEYELFLYEGFYEIRVSADGFFEDDFDEYFNEGQNIEVNFELESSPPITSLITGFITDEMGDPMDVQAVFAFDFMNDTALMNATLNGFYELPVWSGRFIVAGMREGYSVSGEAVFVPPGAVVWVNLTMYEVTSIVRGYVNNSHGETLNETSVQLMDDKTISFDGFETDEEGYYEAEIHPGTFAMLVGSDMGDMMEAGEYDPYVDEIVVPDETEIWLNVTLYESPDTGMVSNVTFLDWEHVVREGYADMSYNKTAESRLMFDTFIGDGDMALSEDEVDKLVNIFLKDVFSNEDKEDDDDNPFPKDSDDQFLLDGLPYLIDENASVMEFVGYAGSWDDQGAGRMRFYSEYNYSGVVEDNITHDIEINLSWRYHDEYGREEMNFHFPEGYGAMGWDKVENMTMEGSNPWIIVPGLNPHREFEDEEEEPVEGVDYVWVHSYLNRTYSVTDKSDTEGVSGGVVNFGMEIVEWEEVNSVILEYVFGEDDNVTSMKLTGEEGVYGYNVTVPVDEDRDIKYRFTVEIEPYFKLYEPHGNGGIIEISDPIAPEVILEASALLVNVDTLVKFDAMLSSDNIGIEVFNFTFGDGQFLETENATVEHIYNATGTFTVKLEVWDKEGNTANATLAITVINDTEAPEVNKTIPVNKAVDVEPDTIIRIVFSEAIVFDGFVINTSGFVCNHTYDADNLTLDITYNGTLELGKKYTFNLSVSDPIGNRLEGYIFTFTVISWDDFDSDGDGAPNAKDAFPDNPMGAVDTDGDGMPDRLLVAEDWNGTKLVEDMDDDGDGYNDTVEIREKTDPLDEKSFPLDTDGDLIPDSVDPDIDNDGVPNEKDEDPYDSEVGEKKEAEDNTLLVIVIVIIVIILGVIFVVLMFLRKKKKPEPVEEPPEPEEWEQEESMGAVMEEDIEEDEDDDVLASENDKCLFCSIILDPVDGGLECSRCGANYDLAGKLLDDDENDVPPPDDYDEDFASLDDEDDFDWADD